MITFETFTSKPCK